MKYGVIKYRRKERVNIGDSIMLLGIRKLYEKMGINKDDIVEIYLHNLSCYDGDYVILPIAAWMDDYYMRNRLPFSPKIIPIFLGIHCISENGVIEALEPYSKFGPFGCRDEATMQTLRKNGLDAYIFGCMSFQSVETRKANNQKKIFLVEVPDKLYKYIPNELKENIVEEKHLYDFTDSNISLNRAEDMELELASSILEKYKNEAKFIVTSRLHCALPCIAMGIPVILLKKNSPFDKRNILFLDHRFSAYDKLLHFYRENEYENIDWNPAVANIEEIKTKQFYVAKRKIEEIRERYNDLCDISYYFERRNPNVYFSGVSVSYLTTKEKKLFLMGKSREKDLLSFIIRRDIRNMHLVIYGAGDKGKWMFSKFHEIMAKSKSCIYVDNDKKLHGKSLNGYKILHPSVLSKYVLKNTIIIIATSHSYDKASQNIAWDLCKNYSLKEGKNFFMLDKLILSAQVQISKEASLLSYEEDLTWY